MFETETLWDHYYCETACNSADVYAVQSTIH